jgi:hypothetical protein
MSAFIVNPNHISALVRWACRARVCVYYGNPSRRLDIPGNEQEACDILLAENVKSYNYRYDETIEETMVYDAFATSLRPIDVIKACHCLEYQSCEHPEWESSTAKAIVTAIEGTATRALPGYDDAPWEIKVKQEVQS